MMVMGRDRAPTAGGGGGVTENYVAFDGTADYLSGFGFSNNDNFTLALKIRLDGQPDANDAIFGSNYSLVKFADYLGDSEIAVSLLDSSFTNIANGSTGPSNVWNDTDELSIVAAVDVAGGMAGSKSVVIYVNGTEVFSSTTTSANPLQLANLVFFAFDAGTPGEYLAAEACGLWISVGSTLDPSTNYSNFFDGSDVWQSIPGTGVVNGVTPDIYIASDEVATLWNSGSDTLSNSFTMNGAVTDV